MDGSSLLGFFQLKVTVLPVMDSTTGVPSGGSGRISKNDDNQGSDLLFIVDNNYVINEQKHFYP